MFFLLNLTCARPRIDTPEKPAAGGNTMTKQQARGLFQTDVRGPADELDEQAC